jgi:hypothetical protein
MLDYNRIQEEFIHKSKDQRKSGIYYIYVY